MEKQKEMVVGDTTERSHKKKLGLFIIYFFLPFIL